MAWTFEFTPNAQKQLDDLDKVVSRRILKFLYERVGLLENPVKSASDCMERSANSGSTGSVTTGSSARLSTRS